MRAGKLLIGVMALLAVVGAARADVMISKRATANMNCSAGVCSPTAAKAVLNATDLANKLAAGDVKVTTGAGATNIVVKDGFSWTSTSRLTLDAIQSVEFDKPVTVAGTGAVTITTNDGGSGGDLLFGDKGNLTFWDLSSSLTINGNSYALANDIATLAADVANNPAGFYALANDYDASVDGTFGSAPMPGTFAGIFEGLGHAVSNVKIVSSDFAVGFFGAAKNGVLRDIAVLNLSISSDSPIAGGMLGESDQAILVGCYVTGSIALSGSSAAVGGLVGESNSVFDGAIGRSHASVAVSAPSVLYAGGLVGFSGFEISQSFATGNVNAGDNAAVGGLIGNMTGAVSQSYATGTVAAGNNASVGGFLGLGRGSIVNSYATGAVRGGTSSTNIGGFAGTIGGLDLHSSYSIGHVKGGSTSGGFIGNGTGSDDLAADYWDTDTSGKSRHQGYGECHDSHCGRTIKGLTTQQIQAGLPAGFDPAIWSEKKTINGGLPYLKALPPPK